MNKKRLLGKSHRYLGLIVGVQLLFWSVGGLYFSMFPIDEIHGDHFKKSKSVMLSDQLSELISPAVAFNAVAKKETLVSNLVEIELVRTPINYSYKFTFDTDHILWVNAITGNVQPIMEHSVLLPLINKTIKNAGEIIQFKLITEVEADSEYRGKKLPAFQVLFDGDENLHAYFDAHSGELITLRTNKWRVFDFLWMMHVMDYDTRDNFNHLLLQFFALLAVVTSLSGLVLWIISQRRRK